MAYEFILTERLDGVALITLNRPEKLNALSFPLVRELDDALTGYEADDDIKAVILTGAGDRAFSAGADIHEMAGLIAEELARRSDARGRDHLAHRQLCQAADRRDQRARLWRRGAVVLDARSADRLRAHPVSLSRGELRPGQFDLVVAAAGRPAEGEGTALHRPGRHRRGGGAHRAAQSGGPRRQADRIGIEIGQMIAKNDARMVQGIKRLLHEEIGMDWHERYDNEDEARATWLAAGHPRDGFKDFLARKPAR